MNCKIFEKLSSRFIEGELSAEDEKNVLEHLKSCPACARRLLGYGAINAAAKEMGEVELPEAYYASLKRSILASTTEKPLRKPSTKKPMIGKVIFARPQTAFAVVVALIFFGLWILMDETSFLTRRTAEDYLRSHDYQGLLTSLQAENERRALLSDSITVTTALASVEYLRKTSKLRSTRGYYATRFLNALTSAPSPPMRKKLQGRFVLMKLLRNALTQNPLEAAKRGLLRFRGAEGKFTLQDLQMLADAK